MGSSTAALKTTVLLISTVVISHALLGEQAAEDEEIRYLRSSSSSSDPFKDHPNRKLILDDVCGKAERRIPGNGKRKEDSYGWLAKIGYADDNVDPYYASDGSLINDRYVLTGAQVVVEGRDNFGTRLTVRIGKRRPGFVEECKPYPFGDSPACNDPLRDYGVEQIIPHEKYNTYGKNDNNIALLRLDRVVQLSEYVSPLCLPFTESNNAFVNKKPFYTGFWTDDNVKLTLRDISLLVTPQKYCRDKYKPHDLPIKDGNICALSLTGPDSCKGSPGAPMVWFNEKMSSFQQIGLVSFSVRNCVQGNYPAVYTRVTHYLQWILDHLKE